MSVRLNPSFVFAASSASAGVARLTPCLPGVQVVALVVQRMGRARPVADIGDFLGVVLRGHRVVVAEADVGADVHDLLGRVDRPEL